MARATGQAHRGGAISLRHYGEIASRRSFTTALAAAGDKQS